MLRSTESSEINTKTTKIHARTAPIIVTGVGGKQILAEDPSGNPIELFEPILPEARLKPSK